MRGARSRRALARSFFLLVVVVTAFSDAALACPVCMDAKDKNRQAFLGSTIFLSLLPLLMVGGLVWWVKRAAARRALEEARGEVEAASRAG